ncbi:MAG: Mur ligase family protein [Bacteroidales bacterium]
MIDFKNIEGICFVGIGGIGMSVLARYFRYGGFTVAGYDRTKTSLTSKLAGEGCLIKYEDSVGVLPSLFRESAARDRVLIIYTPAIPRENAILSYFRENGYHIYKRAEVLGEISLHTDTLAVAGTHGKTTVSTMTAHLLKQSHVDCSAFLGGISKNYDTNLLIGEGRFTVMEADEFDRSFHRLNPLMAVVTSLDADHLDVYGDRDTMIDAYNEFCARLRPGGKLFINHRISDRIRIPSWVSAFTYGMGTDSDYSSVNIVRNGDYYIFSVRTPGGVLEDLHFPFPGKINIENLTAAIAVALNCGVTEDEIRHSVLLFKGVRRRFDIRIDLPHLTYIDDYAHHPEEIRAFITSVREYYSGRKITGIFQPHLFSRTQDHASGFAAILDELDEAIILPVYPAREKPIAGVTSALIYDRMKLANRKMMAMADIPRKLDPAELDVLVTIGAGDIDRLVEPIEEKLKTSIDR